MNLIQDRITPCHQCGECCTKYSNGSGLGSVDEAQISEWENNIPHVIKYLGIFPDYGSGRFGDMWLSPVTGEELERCPFLRKVRNKPIYKCTIYKYRPYVCRNYPVDIDQMKKDKCRRTLK